MTRHAVIFGAGNIGRGFIGQLFCESGYHVTFVDVDDALIETLHRDRSYRLQTVCDDEVDEIHIGPVDAVHAGDSRAVAAAVTQASLGATAVGAAALPHVAAALARALPHRSSQSPLNLIVCENLKGAAAHLRALVEKSRKNSPGELSCPVGFVDTVIGRMVPMPTAAMRHEDPGLIRVEPYRELPVDRGGFIPPIPTVDSMEAHDHFARFTARKLYIHNGGHALLGYLGSLRGYTFGYEALADPEIERAMVGGMRESARAIAAEYEADPAWLDAHIEDLRRRFTNRALGDPVYRLGRDPCRKLAPNDRLVGAAALAVKHGFLPRHLAWGIAAGLLFRAKGDASAERVRNLIEAEGPAVALRTVTGLDPDSPLGTTVLTAYRTLLAEPNSVPTE